MRRMSRTHRVDLDLHYDRINLDPMIKINTSPHHSNGQTSSHMDHSQETYGHN